MRLVSRPPPGVAEFRSRTPGFGGPYRASPRVESYGFREVFLRLDGYMGLSSAEKLASLSAAEREVFLMGLSSEDVDELYWDWRFWARPEQIEPSGNWWSIWLILAGRGFGKTRSGSEWIREKVYPTGSSPLVAAPGSSRRIALVGETAADVRDVMVRGTGGILATSPPDFRPRYIESKRALEWPNGAIALCFSAEDPEQLRGPEHDTSWSDEAGKWKYAQETWDMLQFGMRLGSHPRQLVTTTPRPIPLVRKLLDRSRDRGPNGSKLKPDVVVTRGSTFDNLSNLSPVFMESMRERYEGTRLGRQELNAEILDDVPGALWSRAMLEPRSPAFPTGACLTRGESVPELQRVVVGVDPSGSSGNEDDDSDAIGIVVAGLGVDGLYYVLEDGTVSLGPAGWGKRVVALYEKYAADRVVGEINFGGAMVEYTIRTVRRNISYKGVSASRGKSVRAEPIAALYEQGRVRHLGSMSALEDQMCSMTSGGYLGKGSPDRVDAMVWALTELAFDGTGRAGSAQVRGHW